MPMFIKVSSYEKLWSCLSLLNSISDLDHGVSVSRRCDKLPESGETCEDVSEEGVSVMNVIKVNTDIFTLTA